MTDAQTDRDHLKAVYNVAQTKIPARYFDAMNRDGVMTAAKQHLDTTKPGCGDAEAAENLARRFHETYERLAPDFDNSTRVESGVPWEDVPDDNKRLMIAVAFEIATTTPSPNEAEIRADERQGDDTLAAERDFRTKLPAAKEALQSPEGEAVGGDSAAVEFTLDLLDSIVEDRRIEQDHPYVWGDAGAAAMRLRKELTATPPQESDPR